ncbi:MAG: S41 family peptidase [Deltaproteobacteria bacterium]|nr:S41 family peptidase [Deltaproteobacteria bacterium]
MSGGAVRARLATLGLGLAALALAAPARAATFDAAGRLVFDAKATATQSFEDEAELAEGGAGAITCDGTCSYEVAGGGAGDELALHGERFARVSVQQAPFEVTLVLPAENASYRFRLWVRHARVVARAVMSYAASAERDDEAAYLFPTGRVTSDGWVELVSNPVSVTGTALERAVMRVEGTGVDLDAIEVVREGQYRGGSRCFGAFDPVCGEEALCVAERCQEGARYVPPIPDMEHRDSVADYLAARARLFFGGRFTRTRNLPAALDRMGAMHAAETPWQYWQAYFHGVRMLKDWHTATSLALSAVRSARRLGVCFIEGRADLSQRTWPSAPDRLDVLVAYTGSTGALGLAAGDRLVAVDGVEPIAWARSLTAQNYGYHVASDPEVDADVVEAMRDLIPTFARNFSVIRCDQDAGSCLDHIETIDVRSIPLASDGASGAIPSCDNRPAYHLANPPPGAANHRMGGARWRDLVVDSGPGEHIYGMTFDSLYGPMMTPWLVESTAFFRRQARGVILDHRAGNGGTMDAPQALTELVRRSEILSVSGFMAVAGYDGPEDAAEGLALFERFKGALSMTYAVGSADPDLELPVALIIHRDGSASDWLPHGMKGAPNVRVFGPHQTAGAFSSFYQFGYWSRMSWQLASGDTLTSDGTPLIGHGIEPDELVVHTQSSLLQGRDLPYEAALAWVRSRLK